MTGIYYVTVRLMQNIRRIENRDPEPFMERIDGVLMSARGVKVGLFAE